MACDVPDAADRPDPAAGAAPFLRRFAAVLVAVAAALPAPGAAIAQPAEPVRPATALCDAACLRQNSDRASQACAPRIEAQALGDFDWLTRPFGGLFQEAELPETGKSVARYRGDSIRFLSPQREWVRVSYECGFDVAAQQIAYVNIRLGRLNMPAAAAQAVVASPAPVTRQPTQPNRVVEAPRAPPRAVEPEPARRIVPVGEPSPVAIRQVNPWARPAP